MEDLHWEITNLEHF